MECSDDVVQLLEATNDINYERNSKKILNPNLPPKPSSVQRYSKELTEHIKNSKNKLNSRDLACHLVDKLESDNILSLRKHKSKLSLPIVPHMKPELKKRIKSLKSSGTLKEYFPVISESDEHTIANTIQSDSLTSKRNKLCNLIHKQKSSSECSSDNDIRQIRSFQSDPSIVSAKSIRESSIQKSTEYLKSLNNILDLEKHRDETFSRVLKTLDKANKNTETSRKNSFIDELPVMQRVKRPHKISPVSSLKSKKNEEIREMSNNHLDETPTYSPVIKSRNSDEVNHLTISLTNNLSLDQSMQLSSRKTLAELKPENIEKVLKLRQDSLRKRRENALLVLEMSKKFAREEKEISDLEKKALLYLNTKLKENVDLDQGDQGKEKSELTSPEEENVMTEDSELPLHERLEFFNRQLNDQENIIKKIDEKVANLSKKDLIYYQKSLDQLRTLCNNVIRHLKDRIFETSQVMIEKSNQHNPSDKVSVNSPNSPQQQPVTSTTPEEGNFENSSSTLHVLPTSGSNRRVSIHESQNEVIPSRRSSSCSFPLFSDDTIGQKAEFKQDSIQPDLNISISNNEDKTTISYHDDATSSAQFSNPNRADDFVDQDPTENSQINEISLKDYDKHQLNESTSSAHNKTDVNNDTNLDYYRNHQEDKHRIGSNDLSRDTTPQHHSTVASSGMKNLTCPTPCLVENFGCETFDKIDQINEIIMSNPINLIERSLETLELTASQNRLSTENSLSISNDQTTCIIDRRHYSMSIVQKTQAIIDQMVTRDEDATHPIQDYYTSNTNNNNNNNNCEFIQLNKNNNSVDLLDEKENIKSFDIENLIKTTDVISLDEKQSQKQLTEDTEEENDQVLTLSPTSDTSSPEKEPEINMKERIEILKRKFVGLVLNAPCKMTKMIHLGVDYLWNRKDDIDWPPKRLREFSSDTIDDEDIQMVLDNKLAPRFIDRQLLFDMMIEIFEDYYFTKPEENVFSVKNRNNIYSVWNGYKRPSEKQHMLDIVTIQLIKDLDIEVEVDKIVSPTRRYEAKNSHFKSFQITPASIYHDRSDNVKNKNFINPYYRFSKLSQWMMRKKTWPERLIEMELRSESWSHYEAMAIKVKKDLVDEFWQELMEESLKILDIIS